MPVLPEHGLGEIERGLAGGNAERTRVSRDPRDLLEFVGGVDQRLGGNAADIEAGAAELLRLDDHGVDAQLARADRADIAARARTDHQELAGDVFHGRQPSMKISVGVSSSVLRRCTKRAASKPSTTR